MIEESSDESDNEESEKSGQIQHDFLVNTEVGTFFIIQYTFLHAFRGILRHGRIKFLNKKR